MAAIPGQEQWYIKENGGSGESVGVASTRSNWFIAENVLRDNAEMICRLFNEQAADTKGQNFNNHQHAQPAIPAPLIEIIAKLIELYGPEEQHWMYAKLEKVQQASGQ